MSRPARKPAPHARKAPSRATTLVRHAVKKPKIISDIRHTPIITAPSKAFHSLNSDHAERMKKIKQSSVISHFRPITPQYIDTTPAPAPPEEPGHSSLPPVSVVSKADAHVERALRAATAHTAVKHPKKRKFKVGTTGRKLAAGLAITALLVGFVVYQSIPAVSFSIAARKAGFDAAQPSYTPSGFARERSFSYSPGRVVLSFRSNTDAGRGYKIEQTPSDLTSQQLASQVALVSNENFQSLAADGLTIYISNESASWIRDGILNVLSGESGLSTTQIASIANSMH